MSETIAVVVGYFLGSIDFAVLAARRAGVDIYSEGSGNPGASNVSRVIGRRAGAMVLVADLLKGVVAAGIGELVGGSELVAFAAGGAAVVGHCFPVWHRFRGGKGVATTVGVLLWTIPWLGLGLTILFAANLVVTKVSSYGSLALVVLAVPGVALWAEDAWSAVIMAGIAVLVIVRHRENLQRIMRGDEQTI